MTDTDLDDGIREALTAYTGEEPPLTFTFGEVLTAGRRSRRRRRAAAATAGSLVFVAVTGIFVTAWTHGREEPPPVAVDGPAWPALDPAPFCAAASARPSGPVIAPTTVADERTDYPIRIPTEPADHAAARFSCHLSRVVPPLLPGVTFHRFPGQSDGLRPLQAYPARVFDPDRPGDTAPPYFSAEAVVSDREGVGDIGFGVSAASETVADAITSCSGCAVRKGPHGETVLVHEVTEESGLRLVNVWVHRGDTVAFATASNAIPDENADAQSQQVGRPDPPLTVDQLVEVASAPELDLFP